MFRRVLVIAELPSGAGRAIETARRLAARPERVHVIGVAQVSFFLKFQYDPWDDLIDTLTRVDADLAKLRDQLGDWSANVTSEPALEIRDDDLRASVEACHADVIVIGPFSSWSPTDIVEIVARTVQAVRVPVIAVGKQGKDDDREPIRRMLFPFDGRPQSAAAFAGFLREKTGPEHEAGFFALREVKGLAEEDIDAGAKVAGLGCRIHFAQSDAGVLEIRAAILRRIDEWRSQMLCVLIDADWDVAHWLGGVFVAWALRDLGIPVALIPTETRGLPLYLDPEILCAADVFDEAGPIVVYVERINVLGMPQPLNGEHIAIVESGKLRAVEYADQGYLTIREDEIAGMDRPAFFGLGRVSNDRWRGPVESLETKVALVRPTRRVVLVDADYPAEPITKLLEACAAVAPDGMDVFAVKLGVNTRMDEAKERFLAAGISSPRVFEAGQILGSGRLSDVPGGFEGVLLARVAARLRARGIDIAAIAHRSPALVDASGFAVLGSGEIDFLSSDDIARRIEKSWRSVHSKKDSLTLRLDETTASELVPGNRIVAETDNAAARLYLVQLIDNARERVHVQAYIVHDEPVAREIEAAMVRAAGRGVVVRILVDALYSLHEAMGVRNPFLERLTTVSGIQVAANRPIEGVPSIEDLKSRDHRKLVIVDGRRGVVTGRNLADSYYMGFHEIELTRETPCARIPWFDAGALVEGPIIERIERSFLEAWIGSGQEPFDVVAAPVAGSVAARFVVHRGLRDANTLEAFLALIDSAKRDLLVVNTFPMQFEILRALKNAISRGVCVRVLVGHVRPMFGEPGEACEFFPGGAIRELATQVVHGRIDELVEAGAFAYEFALAGMEKWSADLGSLRPHVHAKLVCADGRLCAIGSANLDITAGYWESEALLVIEDVAFATDVESRFARILAGSVPIDRDDPKWRERAGERAWLSKNWPSLLC